MHVVFYLAALLLLHFRCVTRFNCINIAEQWSVCTRVRRNKSNVMNKCWLQN